MFLGGSRVLVFWIGVGVDCCWCVVGVWEGMGLSDGGTLVGDCEEGGEGGVFWESRVGRCDFELGRRW